MTTAYKPRRMSEILAPAAAPKAEGPTDETPAPAVEKKELPEKYRGKTAEEIADMHLNSERRLGQLQNEVGQLRGLVSDLSSIQRPSPVAQTVEEESVSVSSDDILSDPVGAVNKIVQPELKRRDKEAADAATNQLVQTESAALLADFGDIDSIVGTEDFQKFATRTGARQADFETAAKGEGLSQVRAARRLLEDYNEFKQTQTPPKQEPTPTELARKVATEGRTTGAPISSKPQIFESDVIALIQKDPAKYRSPQFQSELMTAIKEGRFVKSS